MIIGVTNSDKDLVEGTTRVLYNYYKASGFGTIGHLQTCKSDTDVQKRAPALPQGLMEDG